MCRRCACVGEMDAPKAVRSCTSSVCVCVHAFIPGMAALGSVYTAMSLSCIEFEIDCIQYVVCIQ